MDVVIWEAKGEHGHVDAQLLLQQGHGWNGAAFLIEQRLLPQQFLQHLQWQPSS